jgi:riboflavin synthase
LDLADCDIGASIAVNGVCLTAVAVGKHTFTLEASPETLGRTTLSENKRGDSVNLERALRLSDRLGGHLVTGHIDGIGQIVSITKDANAWIIGISIPPALARYLVTKGSVAVDGISLTVNEIENNTFTVSIIPHTAENATIGQKRVGERVNIETDLIGKYVERFLQEAALLPKKDGKSSAVDTEFLKKHGFA